ncbi:hypothetical protein [Stutzerimonas stutzeri]|uniref:hypothetical protein n=1 Tax=Stutzerimonas stutzeri TaxID=316 RepID=UPI00371FFF4B
MFGHQTCLEIATLHMTDEPEQQANAKLLAAAPDLLDALEAMVFGAGAVAVHHEGERKALQMAVDIALAAIAKARGES